MASYHNFLGQESYTQLLLSTEEYNEYLVFNWVAKASDCDNSISHWGPGGTSGAHTTVGIAVGARSEHLTRLQEIA